MVSCAASKDNKTSEVIPVPPNLTKAKQDKIDSLTRITVPSPIINKELSKPDENAPKTKKGSN
jgi:hypothetical protein